MTEDKIYVGWVPMYRYRYPEDTGGMYGMSLLPADQWSEWRFKTRYKQYNEPGMYDTKGKALQGLKEGRAMKTQYCNGSNKPVEKEVRVVRIKVIEDD